MHPRQSVPLSGRTCSNCPQPRPLIFIGFAAEGIGRLAPKIGLCVAAAWSRNYSLIGGLRPLPCTRRAPMARCVIDIPESLQNRGNVIIVDAPLDGSALATGPASRNGPTDECRTQGHFSQPIARRCDPVRRMAGSDKLFLWPFFANFSNRAQDDSRRLRCLG